MWTGFFWVSMKPSGKLLQTVLQLLDIFLICRSPIIVYGLSSTELVTSLINEAIISLYTYV
jgi:hypothetical protein